MQIEIDLESRDRWVCPELFSLGYTEGEKPDGKPLAELAYEIGQRTQAALKPARMQSAPRRSSMEPDTSASPSPSSSATASGQQQQHLIEALENKASVLKELLEGSDISSKGEVQRFADLAASEVVFHLPMLQQLEKLAFSPKVAPPNKRSKR